VILNDLTVLDLSGAIAGAWASRLLAALGARVIKVEPPAGEPGRSRAPFKDDLPGPERSGPFLYINQAKESITLDLTTATGQSLLRQLAARAGLVIEDYPPGSLDQLGVGPQALRAADPRLIVCSITPFGQSGPYRDWLIDDLVAEAVGGLMYTIGLPDREPLKIGGNPAYMNAGGVAFTAIMAAIWQRDETGAGQHIDISLQETVAFTQIHGSIHAAWHNESVERRTSSLMQTRDGWVSAGLEMGVAPDTWARVCELMGRPELIDDPRFNTTFARRDNRDALKEIVSEWVRGESKVEVYKTLQQMRTIAGYVATTEDLYRDEQFTDRGFFRTIDHPVVGPVSYPGMPFRIGDLDPVEGRAPLLGEHTERVLGELGLGRADLVVLRERGVV
jgi:crotonobetainyl-CoA:carnitine CoA-transferase CaiB-like acyl-CoA transferase